MNNDIFEKAFDAIDDELIADAKNPSIRIAARRKKIMINSIAACIAAVLVAIPSIKILGDLNDDDFTNSKDKNVIIQEIILDEGLTSNEPSSSEPSSNELQQEPDTPSKPISSTSSASKDDDTSNEKPGYNGIDDTTIKMDDLYFTNVGVNSPTTTYEKVYSPNTKYLYLNSTPTDKYAVIYETYYQRNFDKSEVQTLANKHFPKMAQTLNISLPSYEIKERFGGLHDHIEIDITGPFRLSQYDNRNIISYTPSSDSVALNGKTVTINQTQSDQEIINSLSEIKQILFDTFDVCFDSAKVYRDYDDNSNYGVTALTVCFYNSGAHPLNNLYGISIPKSDFIEIRFDNYKSFEGDTVSASDLYNVFSIAFWSYRTDNNSPLRTFVKKELLPLKKAEEYLQKGYVLATGGCTLCQSEQTPVDFTDYDYVSFEYKGGNKIGDLTIPYYAFYKNIGTAPNGNMTFAKTYVPAVEVEGYEEYFINKHNNHNTNTSNNNDDYILEDNGE